MSHSHFCKSVGSIPSVGQTSTPLDSAQSSFGLASTPPFVLVSDPAPSTLAETTSPPFNHVFRIQSSRLHDDNSTFEAHEINRRLSYDLKDHIVQASESIAGCLFPDINFGFPINDQFLCNFRGAFLSEGSTIDGENFINECTTSVFLNQTVSTIAQFLRDTKQTSLEPLCYFSALNANLPVDGHSVKRMPDITLLRLIDGCTWNERVKWCDIHAMIEHTREKKPPKRMAETVLVKSFMSFCAQPDRDFVPFLCITREGFHIVLSDHVGLIETDVIPFYRSTGALVFIWMVMGLAFLPDNFIGLDTSMTRRQGGRRGAKKFSEEFPPFTRRTSYPATIQLFISASRAATSALNDATTSALNDATTSALDDSPHTQDSDEAITSISIGSVKYPVIRLIFRTQTLIGRATRAFLVRLPDGRRGVLKDSWIATKRRSEAEFLHNVQIPFCPRLIAQCKLRDTECLRLDSANKPLDQECREKRRIVTYPAGVHISDFSSLWELMVAMLDIVIAIMYLASQRKLHRDISYTNILLREVDEDSSKEASLEARKRVMDLLGLSNIEALRNELKCREGLLIDFDYGATLSVLESELALAGSEGKLDKEINLTPVQQKAASSSWKDVQDPSAQNIDLNDRFPQASGARTGTAPFIAIELLIYAAEHRVVHDLESLFYVLLFICTHLQGTSRHLADPPLYGNTKGHENPSALAAWLKINDLPILGHVKFSHMVAHFKSHVLSHISPYFRPLTNHLAAFL